MESGPFYSEVTAVLQTRPTHYSHLQDKDSSCKCYSVYRFDLLSEHLYACHMYICIRVSAGETAIVF